MFPKERAKFDQQKYKLHFPKKRLDSRDLKIYNSKTFRSRHEEELRFLRKNSICIFDFLSSWVVGKKKQDEDALFFFENSI